MIQPGVEGETKEEAELRRLRQTRETEERDDRQLKEQLKRANGEKKIRQQRRKQNIIKGEKHTHAGCRNK